MHHVPVGVCLAAAMVFVLPAGCGGNGGVAMDVKTPASRRPDIDGTLAARGTLSIPVDAAFNYTSYRSGRSGQSGMARGDSEVHRDGASCRAKAGDGGSAWGAFQLGYCFDNTADVPLDAAVRLRLTAAETASREKAGTPPDDAITTANSTLTFFIKDTNGVVLKQEDLLSNDLDGGPDASSMTHDLVFDARFAPDRGYYLVLAGRTEVKTEVSQSVATSLSVSRCSIDIEWRAPVEAGGARDEPLSEADDSALATETESESP